MRPDLALLVADEATVAAGLFTSNRVRAAPVDISMSRLRSSASNVRGVVVVSGVANAMTGEPGLADSLKVMGAAADTLSLPPDSLLHAATGVIGQRMPVERILSAMPAAVTRLSRGPEASASAATAILTTDTRRKEVAVAGELEDGTRFRVGGMAKGSGMIAPSLRALHATTLAFLTTDAEVSERGWQQLLNEEVERTFNMVSVDGDTSTNDMVLGLASGKAGGPVADHDPGFRHAIGTALESLAVQVVRDGEGATKLLTIDVEGAGDDGDARKAARAVASSLLVKTALFGADPNVGRIACAVGYSGARFDPGDLEVFLGTRGGGIPLVRKGTVEQGMDNGKGERLHKLLQRSEEVRLLVRLGKGRGRARGWGCDLSHGYVHINAHYRT